LERFGKLPFLEIMVRSIFYLNKFSAEIRIGLAVSATPLLLQTTVCNKASCGTFSYVPGRILVLEYLFGAEKLKY
jgi:hypothetical protein